MSSAAKQARPCEHCLNAPTAERTAGEGNISLSRKRKEPDQRGAVGKGHGALAGDQLGGLVAEVEELAAAASAEQAGIAERRADVSIC